MIDLAVEILKSGGFLSLLVAGLCWYIFILGRKVDALWEARLADKERHLADLQKWREALELNTSVMKLYAQVTSK